MTPSDANPLVSSQQPRSAQQSDEPILTHVTDADLTWFADSFSRLSQNIARSVQGKNEEINLALVCFLSEGHLLLEDFPGVGKTSLARAVAESIHGSWKRIQFTPDLLPSDVTGVSVWNQKSGDFEYREGPVFANVVIADEINRASPKTQSALLEVMEERRVTVDGEPREVPRPFVVVATQNPIEMDGTYSLPEAQLDRFLMKMSMDYPDPAAEARIVLSRHGQSTPTLSPVVDLSDIERMIAITAAVRVDPKLAQYAVALVGATRESADTRLGASPRGSLGLVRAAQSLAAASGRSFAIADDVKTLAVPVLGHRMLIAPDAQLRGVSAPQLVVDLLNRVSVPGGIGESSVT